MPLDRMGLVVEISAMVRLLAGTLGGFIRGQHIYIDGRTRVSE